MSGPAGSISSSSMSMGRATQRRRGITTRSRVWNGSNGNWAWSKGCVVPVQPIREMEAWALADGDALRGVFGTSLTNGLPGRVREVEAFPDPKQTLDEAYRRVVGRAKPKKKAADFLDALGVQVKLTRLRQVPSFRQMEKLLQRALLESALS